MIKNCKSCDYGSTNELNDIVCTNSYSANCCEFMRDDDRCQHWTKYDFEFYSKEKMKINYITRQKYQELMKIYDTSKQFAANQLDCFICKTEDCYIAIDNRTGHMWTEEFFTQELCVEFFNGEDLKSLHKRNDNVFSWKDNGVVIV